MAKQTAAAAQGAPQENIEKLQDILLLHDKLGKMLHAVTGMDGNGKPETTPYDEQKNNSFLKLDKMSSVVENFWKNFVDQFKDPTRFNLISIKEGAENNVNVKKALKDLAAGKETATVKKFLDKYEIRVKSPEQAAGPKIDWEALEKATGLTREMLEKSGMASAMTKLAAGEEVKVQERIPQVHRYSESLIDWKQFEAMGVPKEMLIQKGYLDEMLKGRKTRDLIPMTLEWGPARIRFEGRLSLMPGDNGLTMYMNGVRQAPDLDRSFMGHIFSETDKQNLRDTQNLGRTVPLQWRNGQTHDSFISIDRLTNDIVALRTEHAYIPEEIKGVKLTEHEIADLREGKPIKLEGLISDNGKEFSATIQVNADRRGVEYIFEKQKLFNAQSIAGVEITDKMREEVNAGKSILLENMRGRNGELYDRYIKLDPSTGNLTYNKFNPDSPEDKREIIIPKELGGVMLTADDRRELSEGKPVYIQDMTMRSGEVRSMWVRSDLRTGDVKFATSPDKFDERQTFNVPQEIMGAKLSASQRAQLQDGTAVLVDGLKGHDGKMISQWVRFNKDTGKPQMYNENPDKNRNPDRRNVVQRNQTAQTNKRGRGI